MIETIEDRIDEQGQTMAEAIAKAHGVSVAEVIQTVNREAARRINLRTFADSIPDKEYQ